MLAKPIALLKTFWFDLNVCGMKKENRSVLTSAYGTADFNKNVV